jgi:ribosomal protein S18 acetylase RimI-like enzyme
MSIKIAESTDPEDHALVLDRLSAHSDPLLGEEPRGLCLVGRSPDGAVVGGLVGRTGWQYLEVTHLWVDEQRRNSGHASELMFAAEAEAVRRGCKHARLDTFSFQALGFYQKLGYIEFGRLSGYSGCFDRHFLYKALHPADA